MRQTILAVLALSFLASGVTYAAGRDRFTSAALRGRYSGNLTVVERIPVDETTSLTIDARQLLALTFDGKSGVTGITSVSASIPENPPTGFTCVFTITGTYQIGEEGLGTADLAITPTTDCAGPAALQVSLLVGGRSSSRIDITVDGVRGVNGEATGIGIVGSGTLVEQ